MFKEEKLEEEFYEFLSPLVEGEIYPKYLEKAYYPYKEDLYKLLGGQYQIEIPISYKKTDQQIIETCSRANLTKELRITKPEINSIQRAVLDAILEEAAEEWSKEYSSFYNAVSSNFFKENVILNKVKLPYNDILKWNKHRITNGEKFFGFLHREFPQIDVESLRLKQSRLVNDRKIEGTLVISITPLDYVAMSDNTTNWSSCMSWKKAGSHRGGTLEMLSSDKVVVAYIKDKKGRKKWRELFIVNKDIVCGVKGYPFNSDYLEMVVVETLRGLATKNMGWVYDEASIEECHFETNCMYNDLGFIRGRDPYGYCNSKIDEIWYGEEVHCIHCGEPISSSDYDDIYSHCFCFNCAEELGLIVEDVWEEM